MSVKPLEQQFPLHSTDGYVSRWYTSGQELCDAINKRQENLCFADRLEMDMEAASNPRSSSSSSRSGGTLYKHFALVKHTYLDPYNTDTIEFTRRGVIVFGKLSKFTVRIRINNSRDKISITGLKWKWKVSSEKEIQERIHEIFNDFLQDYDMHANNCEHFVNHIRYGKKISDQVLGTYDRILQFVTVVVLVTSCILVAVNMI